ITVHSMKDLFGETSFPIAEESLHTTEVARRHNVGEAIAVDISGGKGGVADVGPFRLYEGEGALSITPPNMEGVVYESSRCHEIEVTVSIEIDSKGIKAPFYSRAQRQDLRVIGKGRQRLKYAGPNCNQTHSREKPANASDDAEHKASRNFVYRPSV